MNYPTSLFVTAVLIAMAILVGRSAPYAEAQGIGPYQISATEGPVHLNGTWVVQTSTGKVRYCRLADDDPPKAICSKWSD